MDYSQFFAQDQFTAMFNDPKYLTFILLLTAWSLSWKGVALWKAAGNKSKPWFVVLLIANTLGILEIVYIFYFSKPKVKKPEITQP